MVKIEFCKKYIKYCATMVIAAMLLLFAVLSFGLMPVPAVVVAESTAAQSDTGSNIISPPLEYQYIENYAQGVDAGYYIIGVGWEWQRQGNPKSGDVLTITIPAEYDDTDKEYDEWEPDYYGKAPVVGIMDSAFAAIATSDVIISDADFSYAANLQYIGFHSFAGSKFTDLDLSPCGKLKEIQFDAFRFCESLKSVSLPANVTIYENAFADCRSLEYIITQNSADYLEYTAMEAMEPYADLLTYETEVIFDLGDGQPLTMTKLYNLSLSYTKIDGEWVKVNGSLPDAGLITGKFGMFACSLDGTVVNEESKATDTLYRIVWITVTKLEVVTNFPAGFVTDKSQKPDSLRKYIMVTAYGGADNEYFREISEYSLKFIDGNYDKMNIYVAKLGLETDFDAPITPKDLTYIWIIVGAGVLLLAATAVIVIVIKRKKIILQTETVEVIKTVEVTVQPRLPEGLTERELEIAKLILKGLHRKEMTVALCVSEATVKKHIAAVYKKSGCNSKTEFRRKYGDGE